MGPEDQFRLPSLSGCCRLGEATFDGTHGNGRDAPKAAVKGLLSTECAPTRSSASYLLRLLLDVRF